jgi:hypothetical protein
VAIWPDDVVLDLCSASGPELEAAACARFERRVLDGQVGDGERRAAQRRGQLHGGQLDAPR